MNLKDLQPVLTLISESEERLSKKMGGVHSDVIATRKQVTKINGRLRKVEVETSTLQSNCSLRKEIVEGKLGEIIPTVEEKLDAIKPVLSISRIASILLKFPKTTLSLIFLVMLGAQTIVILCIEHQWIGKLIDKWFS